MRTLICGGTIITSDSDGTIFPNSSLLIDNGRIADIIPSNSVFSREDAEIVDAANFVVIPGFIQTHIHLCQTLFRGLADDLQLLEWLKHKIFPFESAHNEHSMYISALLGIAELIRSGTTTILDMGSIQYEEEIIRAIGETGMRAFVGKAMMDINEMYPKLKESTNYSIKTTRDLAERWHNSYEGRIRYAVAPRFVLSCTDFLIKEAYGIANSLNGVLFHTHASENKNEIKAVRERCKMRNIEFLNHIGVLSEKSCLAHCIHINDSEVGIIRDNKTNVVHCPSSNLKLGSGIANIPMLDESGINVTLGADAAPCNNNLNIFQEMRLASLIQKPIHGHASMPAKKVFKMATINGAKALGLEKEIGSIEIGKKADIVMLDLNEVWNPVTNGNDMYSAIVYSAGPENVYSVMIEGKWVYRKKAYSKIDKEKVVSEGKKELAKLLERCEY